MANRKTALQHSNYHFLSKKKLNPGAYLENDNIVINTHQQHFEMSITELALQGKHNLYNSMASGIAAKCARNHAIL